MPRTIARCLTLLLVLWAQAAAAGPWSRAEDGVFVALSTEVDRQDNSYSSLYAEYGLSPRTTLGLELGHSNAGETSALVWFQRALDGGEGANRLTVATGAGAVRRDGTLIPLAQVGAAWGRGLDTVPGLRRIPGGGWLAVDARIKIAGAMKDQAEVEALAAEGAGLLSYLTPETVAKAELTLGWHATQGLMLVNQLRLEDRDDTGFSSKLAVSVVGDLLGPAKLELGVIGPISGQGEQAVKLGTWFEF